MIREFTHVEPGQEVEAIAGHYVVDKEIRVTVRGKEALVVLGAATWDKSCCGIGGCRYAMVPGFLVEYHVRQNAEGRPVSEIETVNDPDVQREIREKVAASEFVQQVNFW